jgi:broad specificity phosphatase PhoE
MALAIQTTVLLVRHAHTDALGTWLCGRRSGISLSTEGRRQANALGAALKMTYSLSAIYSSPLARAHMTAVPISLYQRCPVQTRQEFAEIDFGKWTGRTFSELEHDPDWHVFNHARSAAVIHDGEQPAAAQARIVDAVANVAAVHPGETIAIVTHAELIRMALQHYLSIPLDAYQDIRIDPASVSAVVVERSIVRVAFVNRVFPESELPHVAGGHAV